MASLYNSDIVTCFSQSATLLTHGERDPDSNYNLIAVIALAQRLGVNFLPLTWQAPLGELGQGGQARISQAIIKLQTGFAFKRFRGDVFDNNDRNPFQEIAAEMIILSHPAIRENPLIVSLEGICWDIQKDDDHVLPVLVFQKSEFHDLLHFATEGVGRGLALTERLKLCADIGIAVRDMHANSKKLYSMILIKC